MSLTNKEKAVALLNSIQTGATEPASYVNPNKYIQHNLSVADGLAERISKFPAESIEACKRAVYASIDLPIAEALKEEAYQLFQATSKTPAIKRFTIADENGAQFDHNNQKNWENMLIDLQEIN